MTPMAQNRISKLFKKIFNIKTPQKQKTTYYTNQTTCTWDGVSMSKYSGTNRVLTYREHKWLTIYAMTGTDIRKRGYWKIAQKQLKHLFSTEQLNEHTQLNKSLSTLKNIESREQLDKIWKTMLSTHCQLNHIPYIGDIENVTTSPSSLQIQETTDDNKDTVNTDTSHDHLTVTDNTTDNENNNLYTTEEGVFSSLYKQK